MSAKLSRRSVLTRSLAAGLAAPYLLSANARGASDREAIRTATDRLEQGWATGVFIDGTRQADGRVNNPQAGAALLAARQCRPDKPD